LGVVALGALALVPAAARAQSSADCLACHEDKATTTERNGKEVSLYVDEAILRKSSHTKIVCVGCHAGFNPDDIPHKPKIEPVNCARCHAEEVVRHPFHPEVGRSVATSRPPKVSCKQCHGAHDVAPATAPGGKFHDARLTESCGSCHERVAREFPASEHGKALAAGTMGAPTCLSCHRHAIVAAARTTADSLATREAQARLCASCHLDDPEVRARTAPSAGFIAAYTTSVHGRALASGKASAANCVSCHGSHSMKRGADPASLVHRNNVATTCAECHQKPAREFRASIHGAELARGNADTPTCTSCHGEHTILAPSDPQSPVAASNVSEQVCSPCHSSVKLASKYGLRSDRFQTYTDSYHGLAIRGGALEVANCSSCHGSHAITAANDPASPVSKANLAVTCGRCHPGANERFAVGAVHVEVTSRREPVLYWVATGYVILIVLVVGGMAAHNVLDFYRKSRRKLMIRRGLIAEEPAGHATYVRMSLNERLQHGALVLSFITLVVSGFALKFPDAWWVAWIREATPLAFLVRSWAHRVAGVVMMLGGVYHVYYVLATPRGRQLLADLLPTRKDPAEALQMVKYNLGLTQHRPQLGRFSYIEKSEYWALVWGTVIMGGTGIILWFNNTFIGVLTKLGWDIAQTVHLYEAILATLAIVVWHFYFVIFNPDVYPVSLAAFTGTLTEEEMREEHPAELRRLKEQQNNTESAAGS
jgi:formate dehydrogenase gamma subunit